MSEAEENAWLVADMMLNDIDVGIGKRQSPIEASIENTQPELAVHLERILLEYGVKRGWTRKYVFRVTRFEQKDRAHVVVELTKPGRRNATQNPR